MNVKGDDSTPPFVGTSKKIHLCKLLNYFTMLIWEIHFFGVKIKLQIFSSVSFYIENNLFPVFPLYQ